MGVKEPRKDKGKRRQIIGAHLLDEYPLMSATARNWISAILKEQWVKDYFDFLNRQVCCLRTGQRKEMLWRMVDSNDTKFHEAIAELVYVALWNHLQWSFEKDPVVGRHTPDFKVCCQKSGTDSFYCDVTVVRHSHPRRPHKLRLDDRGKAPELPLVKEPIQQAHRFLMKIKEKFGKYSYNVGCVPFLVCFFQSGFEDCFYLSDFQIRNALFGDLTLNFQTGEAFHQPSVEPTAHAESHRGVFAFEKYKALTAVITCKQEFTHNYKPAFGFNVYLNPLGAWTQKDTNPFAGSGLPVNRLRDKDTLELSDPKYLEFW